MLISIPCDSIGDQVPLHLKAFIPQAEWYTFSHKLKEVDDTYVPIMVPCGLLGTACFIVVMIGVEEELFTFDFEDSSWATVLPIGIVILVVSFLFFCIASGKSKSEKQTAVRELNDKLHGVRVQFVTHKKYGDDDFEGTPREHSFYYLEIIVPAPAPGTSAHRLIKAALVKELNRMRGITFEPEYEADLIQILKSIECSAVAEYIKRLKSEKSTLTKEVFINRLIEAVEALYETPPGTVVELPEVPLERTAPLNVSSQNTIEEIPTKETNPLQYSWRCEGAY